MYVDLFSNSSNPALREKTHDVRDLGLRLLSNLLMRTSESVDYHGRIIVADDLLPSDILKLSAQRAEGVVLIGGGVTAHISVLARSLRMPLVIVKEALLTREEKAQGPFIILDADQGNVLINQTADVVRQYQALLIARAESDSANTRVTPTTTTLDGQRIRLMANINLLSELPSAQRLKAEGIGLYRSEFPFIVRKSIPTEEEQFRIYRKVLESMPDHEVLLRTLDVGGDKILPFFPVLTEANPFLGLRALRFSMRNKEIFIQQLRAMLRAGATCPLSIMFPLVMSLEDFEEAREMVSASIRALQEEHLPCNEAPRLGVMIEVPSAVELAVELARAADFLCIGSNDLIQYTLAVDRTNPNIANLFTPHHPAVLRAIGRVAEAAASQGKPVSLCGDMATDERLIPFLVGVGIQSFSMDPKYIPRIQQVIAALSFNDARRLAREILQLGRVKAIEAHLSIAP
jgi:phosphotransferase system enzyme I (PtsP)